MLKVVFCHDGQPVSDFKALDFADGTINTYCRTYAIGDKDMMVRFSTECVLDAFVLRTMEDDELAENIEFYYKDPNMEDDIQMEFNEYRGLKIPDGLDDFGVHSRMVRNIVRLGLDKIRAKAENGKDT